MRPKGQDVADAIHKWIQRELIEAPSRGYELGKFFFAVSTGTVGLFAAIKNIQQSVLFDLIFKLLIIFLTVSLVFAIIMTRPRNWKIGDKSDLFGEYSKELKRTILYTWIWFCTWLVGFLIGLVSLFL